MATAIQPLKITDGFLLHFPRTHCGSNSSTLRVAGWGGMQLPVTSVRSEGGEPMIDLVYCSFIAALLPIGLHVGLGFLSLMYWSFLAPIGSIVMHVCVRIRATDAGLLVWRSDRSVSLNRHPRLTFSSPSASDVLS
jgi:hypothetical protein